MNDKDQTMPNPIEPQTENQKIEDAAVRAARLVYSLIGFGLGQKSLTRAQELLSSWQKTFPHPHAPAK